MKKAVATLMVLALAFTFGAAVSPVQAKGLKAKVKHALKMDKNAPVAPTAPVAPVKK